MAQDIKDTEFKIYDKLGNENYILRVGCAPPANSATKWANKTLVPLAVYNSSGQLTKPVEFGEVTALGGAKTTWHTTGTLSASIDNNTTGSTMLINTLEWRSGPQSTAPAEGDLIYDSAGTVGFIKTVNASSVIVVTFTVAGSGSSALPSYPSTAGTYDLQLTVDATGTGTLSWATVTP